MGLGRPTDPPSVEGRAEERPTSQEVAPQDALGVPAPIFPVAGGGGGGGSCSPAVALPRWRGSRGRAVLPGARDEWGVEGPPPPGVPPRSHEGGRPSNACPLAPHQASHLGHMISGRWSKVHLLAPPKVLSKGVNQVGGRWLSLVHPHCPSDQRF